MALYTNFHTLLLGDKMKLVTVDDMLILFLNRVYIQSLDFSDKESVQKYMKQLLSKLRNKYDLEFDGYYEMTLYLDMNYGVIIEVKKEELEYLDYFSNQIEMNTKVIEGSFLYEVSNFDENFMEKFWVYKLKDKIYLRAKDNISNIEMGIILESAKIIYGDLADKIIRKAKVLR